MSTESVESDFGVTHPDILHNVVDILSKGFHHSVEHGFNLSFACAGADGADFISGDLGFDGVEFHGV